MYCANCGAQVEEGQYHCPECWTLLEQPSEVKDFMTGPFNASAKDHGEQSDEEQNSEEGSKRLSKKSRIIIASCIAAATLVMEPLVCRAIVHKNHKEELKLEATETAITGLLNSFSDAVNNQDGKLYSQIFQLDIDTDALVTEMARVFTKEEWEEVLPEEMVADNMSIHALTCELRNWFYLGEEGVYQVTADMDYKFLNNDVHKSVDCKVAKRGKQYCFVEWIQLERPIVERKFVDAFVSKMDKAVSDKSLDDYVACGDAFFNSSPLVPCQAMMNTELIEDMTTTVKDYQCLSFVETAMKYHILYVKALEADVDYEYCIQLEDESVRGYSSTTELMLVNYNELKDVGSPTRISIYSLPQLVAKNYTYEDEEYSEFYHRVSQLMLEEKNSIAFEELFYMDERLDMEYVENLIERTSGCQYYELHDIMDYPVVNKDSAYYREGISQYYCCACTFSDYNASRVELETLVLVKEDGKFYILTPRIQNE